MRCFLYRHHRTAVEAGKRLCSSQSVGTINTAVPRGDSSQQSGEGRGALPVGRQNPLAVLDQVFRRHKVARQFHMELISALADGNATEASELAAALAKQILRHRQQVEEVSASAHATAVGEDNETSSMPPVSHDGIASAIDKIVDVHQQLNHNPTPGEKDESLHDAKSCWKNPDALTVTIIETSFEDAEPDDFGDTEQALRILDQYLLQESERWTAQKHAIAKIVLETAQRLGITPSHIHHSDGQQGDEFNPHTSQASVVGKKQKPLNALKHCNVVIRGEAPEFDDLAKHDVPTAVQDRTSIVADCEAELSELEERMHRRNMPPMTPDERRIALSELILSRTTIRYSVGLQRSLSDALDVDRSDGNAPTASLSTQFHTALMAALNPRSARDDGESASSSSSTVTTPVLPFTFMIKLCVWYDPQAP